MRCSRQDWWSLQQQKQVMAAVAAGRTAVTGNAACLNRRFTRHRHCSVISSRNNDVAKKKSLREAQLIQDFRLFVAATLDNIQAPRVVNAAPNARKANSLVSRGDINPSSNDGPTTTLACADPQRGFRGRNGTLGRLGNEQGRKRKSDEGTTHR